MIVVGLFLYLAIPVVVGFVAFGFLFGAFLIASEAVKWLYKIRCGRHP